MNLQQTLIVLTAVTLSMTNAKVMEVFPDARRTESVINYMARSNDLTIKNSANSARAVDCFDQYIKSIDEIAKAYQQNHDSCIQASRQAHTQVEAATVDNRNALASSAEESCNLLSRCSEIESAEEVFQCFIAGSSKNAKTMYGINDNAGEYLSNLQEEFRLIQNREYKCTNDTKRTYEKDSFEAYNKFNKCNLGITSGNPEPENPEVTEAPVETEPTEEPENPEVTEAPVETEPTEQPENPEVTEAPVETEPTEEPENPEVTEAPVETEPTEEPDSPENTEDPESPESTEGAKNDENKSNAKFPERDLIWGQRILSQFKKLRSRRH